MCHGPFKHLPFTSMGENVSELQVNGFTHEVQLHIAISVSKLVYRFHFIAIVALMQIFYRFS